MLEAIKEKLRAAGLTVYDFAEKIGTCKAPYVVVYDSGVEAVSYTHLDVYKRQSLRSNGSITPIRCSPGWRKAGA